MPVSFLSCRFGSRDLTKEGVSESISSLSSVGSDLPAVISVSMNPGAIALTLICKGPSSLASDLVNPTLCKQI